MKISKALRPNRDIPFMSGGFISAAAAGSGSDFEQVIVSLPDLAQGVTSGYADMVAENALTLRWILLNFEAAVTGVATNNFTLNINQKRNGVPLVNTTSLTTVVAGINTVTPASMANIAVNSKLIFSGGTGATETVVVQSVNTSTGTFTANFANGHSGAYTIVSAPLATVTFASGQNATAYVPLQYAATPGNAFLGTANDVLTIARVSAGTGLASPAFHVTAEWVPAGPQ